MANEQVSVLLKFTKEDGPLLEAQKQVNGFLKTIQEGFKLNIGFHFADALMEIPAKLREVQKAAVEYAETVTNMATQTRMTTGSFQVFSLLAAQTGIEVGKLTSAVQKMALAADEAVNGNKKLAGAFSDLKLNASEFSALSTPLQFEALAKAAAEAGWSTAALNDLSAILGEKNMAVLLPSLIKMAEGWAKVSEEAMKAGAVTSEFVIKSLAEIAEKQKVLDQVSKTVGANLAESLGGPFLWARQVAQGYITVATMAIDVNKLVASSIFGLGNTTVSGLAKKYTPSVDAGKGNGAAEKSPETLEKEAAAAKKLREEQEKADALAEKSMNDDIEEAIKQKEKADAEAAQLATKQQLFALETQIKAAEDAGDQAKADDLKLDVAMLQNYKEGNEAVNSRVALLTQEMETKRTITGIEAGEIPLKERMAELDKARTLIAAEHATEAQKQAELTANTEAYRVVVQQIVDLETKRLALTSNPIEAAKLKAEIAKLKAEATDRGKKQEETHPAYSSASDAAKGGLQDVVSKSASVFQNVHDSITNIAQSLTGSLTNGIEGLINRTMTWSQALRNIGSTIISSIVASFAKMVAEWAVSRLAIAALNLVFGKTDAEATNAQAAEAAAAWAPAATAASIASFGVASGTGLAAFLVAMSLGTAGAAAMSGVAGFSEGGPTGSGGIVHAGEWVAPAWMVGDPVLGNVIASLEGLRTSSTPSLSSFGRSGALAGASGGGGGGGGMHSIVLTDDRQNALRAMRQSKGRATIARIGRLDRAEFFT